MLISVAFLTLIERKILGLVGVRLSPLKMRFLGTLQPLGDAIKLAFKFDFTLSFRINLVYLLIGSAFLSFSLSRWAFTSLHFTETFSIKMRYLIILFLLTFRTIRILIVGWVSLSKYPLIGSIRSATQAISYESIIIMVFLLLVYLIGSFKLNQESQPIISLFFVSPLLFVFWLFTSLAEMGRTPYDFSEGERELVSGFNTEFGSSPFSLIFLSEYSNILFFRFLTSLIFFQSSTLTSFIFVLFWYIWIRSVLPRSRFDHLIDLAWKFFIPLVTLMILFYFFQSFHYC